MYKFITKFLNPKPPVPFTISFDEIPGWIRDRRQKADDTLSSETNSPVTKIRNGMAQLQHIVNGIAGAEHDPAIHPKLKSIARNSLPLFVKAMNASLSKELPEDVEDFYAVAVESVKGCINSTRGQGRYLQIVFPEEMKAVKTGIDAIGHEINSMTTSLGIYRKERDQLDVIIRVYETALAVQAELNKSEGKDQRTGTRISEIQERIKKIETGLENIGSDEAFRGISYLMEAKDASEKKRDDVTRRYTSLTMTASHVFRKAEKIAVKQRHPEDLATIRQVMEVLSDHSVPDCSELIHLISASAPLARRMIEAGEIPLKNKEERAIFSDTARFSDEIGAICNELRLQEEECMKAESELAAHPLVIKKKSFEREKSQLEAMLVKESLSREELAQWKEKNKEKVPLLVEELRRKFEGIVGGNVQIQISDTPGV